MLQNYYQYLYFQLFKFCIIQKMAWICGQRPNFSQESTLFIANQFRTVDPQTKQIYCQIVFDDNSFQLQKYKDWRRIKVVTLNTQIIRQNLRQSKQHFIDPDFPHDNSMLSKDNFEGVIQWKRIRDVVQNAVYSKEQTLKNLQKIKLNRKQFEKALILISRSSPTLFKELLSKTLNSQGMYEFKLFRNGYIHNIAIDDYIPVHEGFPLFVGPARQNQVYPILLEKALAKVCGGYEQIPENADEILQIIFCGPVKRQNISQLRQSEKLGNALRECISRRSLSVLQSKREQKIRNYGLNDNEVYLLVNHHQIEVQSKQNVYELVSETKLSAWNGRFALNDDVWNKIKQQRKFQLYQQLKNNRSFLIGESDIARHFQQILIFQSLDIHNKDWCQNQSDNSFPSFTTFQLIDEQRVFLRVTGVSKIRQTLILVRELAPKTYQFVTSHFLQRTYYSQISIHLQPGKYILAAFHEWFLDDHGKYYVFLASQSQISLHRGGVVDNGFLLKSITNYQQKLSQSQPEKNKLYKMRLQVQKLGLAWLVMRPNISKTKSISVQINHQFLEEEGWQILQPYRDVPAVHFTDKNAAEQLMIVLKKKDADLGKKHHFPVAAFKLKQ